MTNLTTLNDALETIKRRLNEEITKNGESGKKSVINSEEIINYLHEVVKWELVNWGVNKDLIHPPLGQKQGEKLLAGFLKNKRQDICVFPNDIPQRSELLEFKGINTGKTDPFGELFTEHILTINLRSQLSSSAKNFDTIMSVPMQNH